MRFLVFLIFSAFISPLIASDGDSTLYFTTCVGNCVSCFDPKFCPCQDKYFWWSCNQECEYFCMWKQEDIIKKERAITTSYKYFGKWPFKRFYGIQEVFSTIFSLLNAFMHIRELYWRSSLIIPLSLPSTLRYLTLAHSIVAILAWICSTIFHIRDTRITERMDYSAAIAHSVFNLWFACVRILFDFYPMKILFTTIITGIPLFIFYFHHVYYLTFVKFDYGYNMYVMAIVGILQFLIWNIWAIKFIGWWFGSKKVRNKSKVIGYWILVFQWLLLLCFVLFELRDFPPYFSLIDAHSLWHCSTIPLILVWYRFRELDVQYIVNTNLNIE